MICPLQPRESNEGGLNECDKEHCAWWNPKVNFNSKTKQFEGECCIKTLSNLKISGGINTHPF